MCDSPSYEHQLETKLYSYLRGVRRTSECEAEAERCRALLETACQNTLTGARLNVFIFASSQNGFGTNESDLDVTVLFHGVCRVSGHGFVRFVLETLADQLGRLYGDMIAHMKLIAHAKTPIIKLRCGSVQVDLSVENKPALKNTVLLHEYASFHEHVVHLVLCIKGWAKAKMLVGARCGQLTSYAWTLLVIHFLQCGDVHPGRLPVIDTASVHHNYIRLNDVTKKGWSTSQSLAELYRLCIDYYSTKFLFGEEVVSIVRPAPLRLARYSLLKTSTTKQRFYVEDPFEEGRDLGGVLQDGGVMLMQQFRAEHNRLRQVYGPGIGNGTDPAPRQLALRRKTEGEQWDIMTHYASDIHVRFRNASGELEWRVPTRTADAEGPAPPPPPGRPRTVVEIPPPPPLPPLPGNRATGLSPRK